MKDVNNMTQEIDEEKDYWYIEANGEIIQCFKPKYINHLIDPQKEIGNYFESKEEAEKALEKLKAFKTLKDKGFKFEWWLSEHNGDRIDFYIDDFDKETKRCLDLLFNA